MRVLAGTACVSVAGFAALQMAAGCDWGCEATESCSDLKYQTGGTGGAGGSSSSGGSMTSASMMTSSSSISTECDPLKLAQGASIDATCGVFVEPGKTGGDGTQGNPFGTLAEALVGTTTNALPIYVCATGVSLNEPAVLTKNERLLGGLTCGDWKATTTKTPWTAGANEVPLRLDHATSVLVQGFAITAAPAMGVEMTSLQGRSSIAVVADTATATFDSVDITAGAGAKGGDGMDQVGKAPGRQSDMMSFDGHVGGGCNMPGGAAQDYMTCPAGGGTTEGGKGGDGGNLTGLGGGAGAPALGGGAAGAGDTGAMGWDCMANSGLGGFGTSGMNGTPGTGGNAAGTLSATSYSGDPGGPGGVGGIGQGGGGGGGRKKSIDGCSTTGASGGSGGAGGCGGLGGAGGGAGGASIALVSVNATLTLSNVHLTAAQGGGGGAGGDGQLGGNGGAGAFGGGSACKGGDGGKGGDGAGGGGGKGGPSIGLASVGPAPAIDAANITAAGPASAGGAAGGGNIPGSAGSMGDVAAKMGF